MISRFYHLQRKLTILLLSAQDSSMSKPMLCVGLSIMMLYGCGGPPLENLETLARPVKSQIIDAPQGSGVRNFPGRIESANRADLAFRVG
ncbi:MAG: hypothetical protein ACJAWG_003022, partial [Candidatus Azotimanducaceae bacterium]